MNENMGKIERVLNGLSQVGNQAHSNLADLQDKLQSLLNEMKTGKSPDDTAKEEVVNLGNKISSDLEAVNSNLPTYIEAYEKTLNQVAQRSLLAQKEIDVEQDSINDLDLVLDQLVQIKSAADSIVEMEIAKQPNFKIVSRQARQLEDFVQEIANKADGTQGNNDLKFISGKLKEIENYPQVAKSKLETLSEQTIMDNNLVASYCRQIKEVLAN